MVQVYIGSLHKFFGSDFSWQLNNLGRSDSELFVGNKISFMWRYHLFQLLQIIKFVGPFKDAGALTPSYTNTLYSTVRSTVYVR